MCAQSHTFADSGASNSNQQRSTAMASPKHREYTRFYNRTFDNAITQQGGGSASACASPRSPSGFTVQRRWDPYQVLTGNSAHALAAAAATAAATRSWLVAQHAATQRVTLGATQDTALRAKCATLAWCTLAWCISVRVFCLCLHDPLNLSDCPLQNAPLPATYAPQQLGWEWRPCTHPVAWGLRPGQQHARAFLKSTTQPMIISTLPNPRTPFLFVITTGLCALWSQGWR